MGNLERALHLREKKEFEKSNRILMDLASHTVSVCLEFGYSRT
ncbi:hypothetical protein [Peribacillus frigoritolerans]